MGKLDILAKEYMRQPAVFADVFNQFLYHGRQIIVPARLTELDTTEIAIPYGTDHAFVPEQRYRDAVKTLMAMTDGTAAYCILAVENEGKINYAMPVKDGLYDFLQLSHQVTSAASLHRKSKSKEYKPSSDEFLSGFWKSDRLLPVVTVVVYFGAEDWDGPLSLREMYADCDDEILKYAADYRINLIAPYALSDHEIDGFQTNLREIMRYIKYSKDKKKLQQVINSENRFKSVEREAMEIMNAATNSKMKFTKGEEMVDVCVAIQGMMEDSKIEGRVEGSILTCKEMGHSQQDAKDYIMAKYGKTPQEADELIKLYWK
ncbi:MAG: Rpn family recombination-promoting nuclease/putative transposase [Lachnospiraceae bacterium]